MEPIEASHRLPAQKDQVLCAIRKEEQIADLEKLIRKDARRLAEWLAPGLEVRLTLRGLDLYIAYIRSADEQQPYW